MSNSLTLGLLVKPWMSIEQPDVADIAINHLHLDSRQIEQGDVFVAIIGHAIDGRNFIPKAIEKGAVAIIAQSDEAHPDQSIEWLQQVPIIYLNGLPESLSHLAGRRYQSQSSKLIGITGTNGKTTISQLIAQWGELVGTRSAVMGTTGNGFLDDLQPAANTTGNAIEVQAKLAELAERGAQQTALEVSSHGLVQGRIKALNFAVGVFTNLSRDHLDYHGSMEEYALAKKLLFTTHNTANQVINADDKVGAEWLSEMPEAIAVSLDEAKVSQYSQNQVLYAERVQYSEQGIEMDVAGSFGSGVLNAPLIGQFNASNILVALATLLSLGHRLDALLETAPQLSPVIGRMELFSAENKAKVVVDYAHTPDALEKALMALRVHCEGQLWTIFGCGGDRDKGKRPLMAQAGEKLADKVILSDDNPRSEDPAAIVADMLVGIEDKHAVQVEHHRFDALKYALDRAQPQDIILLAGKGHEDYQVIGSETVHYSDRESAAELLGIQL
ncbi:UDP-N-acetylmuramoyl-L-alanyl-D-glutamate--2,6-diaminopimelate ligase [Vibrio maerlii]|uniref:UDP-N-acetylmuramoyl-L-alanyl-D-glutamate--2, 6-diaminopimelate ligase n=1 Tax=Vibrio maerlii TaxID=2231648 RepID=UPI000E3CB6C8|nr:UDP-N-acetylmuramoyl-L-alanyl-D-glutamate--2,6-diaminopimelate ligase [Vibrio maerlii]